MSYHKCHICSFGWSHTFPGHWECLQIFNVYLSAGFKIKCHIANATFVLFSLNSRALGTCRSALNSIFMQIPKLLMQCLDSQGFSWSFSCGLILVKIFSGAQLPLQPGSWATSENHLLMTIFHCDCPHVARNVFMMVYIILILIIFLTTQKWTAIIETTAEPSSSHLTFSLLQPSFAQLTFKPQSWPSQKNYLRYNHVPFTWRQEVLGKLTTKAANMVNSLEAVWWVIVIIVIIWK